VKAALFHGKQDIRIEDVDVLEPGVGEVRLRNAYNGICGSDLHFYDTPETSGVDFSKPHPVTGRTLPQILGHEFSGTVDAVGAGVDTVKVGDRVSVFPMISCGICSACARGQVNVCRVVSSYGTSSASGGLAEFSVVRVKDVHVLPDSVDLKLGALVEPMAVAWHAVRRSGIEAGQHALVVGGGPIGIGIAFALRARGVTDVTISEISPDRLAVLRTMGIATVVDPAAADLGDHLREATGQRGVDVAFDTAGGATGLTTALAHLTPGGCAVELAIDVTPREIVPIHLVLNELRVLGTLAYLPSDFDAVIAAMADGAYNTAAWVDVLTLDQIVPAIDDLRAARRTKVLIRT
jgi:(R,R)-butanediol dehydrogenase/meso-butanediol dehydrogenase/diacetyl reductase